MDLILAEPPRPEPERRPFPDEDERRPVVRVRKEAKGRR